MRTDDNLEDHMVLNTPDAPWNQPDAPEETAAERREREKAEEDEKAEKDAKDRELLVESLHDLADFLKERTDIELPRVLAYNSFYGRESFLAAALALAKGGKVEKAVDPETASYPRYHVVRWFGTIKLEYDIQRKIICRLVTPAVYDCPDILSGGKEFPEAPDA